MEKFKKGLCNNVMNIKRLFMGTVYGILPLVLDATSRCQFRVEGKREAHLDIHNYDCEKGSIDFDCTFIS